MARHAAGARVPETFQLVFDTSNFFQLENNDVIVLDGTPFWIRSYEREGRFGLDDEPKYWVRRAIDLGDGSTKVIKLVFHEEFETAIGDVVVKRFRSPRKEGRILDLVRGHRNFMHGRWVLDAAGNNVRILDFIRGRRFDEIVAGYGADHHDYFHHWFPAVLDEYVELVKAIRFLHDHGEKHGDIRRDHIIRDREDGCNRWIDFDYNYQHGENMFGFDLQGLGNILIFLAGRGDLVVSELSREKPELFGTLTREDLSITFKNRVANVGKIYPYLPDSLNRVLRHFSAGARLFYENTDQMLDDLARAASDVRQLTGGKS
jgi:hypothetical protein